MYAYYQTLRRIQNPFTLPIIYAGASAKVVHGFQPLTDFSEHSVLDVIEIKFSTLVKNTLVEFCNEKELLAEPQKRR